MADKIFEFELAHGRQEAQYEICTQVYRVTGNQLSSSINGMPISSKELLVRDKKLTRQNV